MEESGKSVEFAEGTVGGGDGEGAGKVSASTPPRGPRSSLSARLPPRKMSYVDRRSQWPRSLSMVKRDDHMTNLIRHRRESMRALFPSVEEGGVPAAPADLTKSQMEQDSEFVRHLQEFLKKLGDAASVSLDLPSVEIRLHDVNYAVETSEVESKIMTIYNASPVYWVKKKLEWMMASKEEKERSLKKVTKSVLSNVNLVLKPKSMYLVLGPPLSGKTSMLKAIAGQLPQGDELTGQILYNNLVCSGEGADENQRTLFKNLVAFVRQKDEHAPRLTVAETFLFSGNCKDENVRKNAKGVSEEGKVGLTLEGLGLSHVKDTFVGNEQIRGVSGGQRRRVTLGEMLVFDTPLLCGDEISTGLDTASTVDILRILSYSSRLLNRISVVSLLQPSPEAVALFDEVILLGDGGHVIYVGPTEEACDYFRGLGYVQPDAMDDADYLLAVASSDRKHLYRPEECDLKEGEEAPRNEPHTPKSFAESFQRSKSSVRHSGVQKEGWENDWTVDKESDKVAHFRREYQNSFWDSVWLNLKRSFILWTRDRIFIRASIIKNVAMGLSVGFVFLNTDMNSSFFGRAVSGQFVHHVGSATSLANPSPSYPQMLIDVLLFGTFVYWMVGFVATASGFLIYLALFFSFNFTMGQVFGLLASVANSKTVVQAGGAVILLLNALFCGIHLIPNYWIWIYWMVPLSWVYRALLLNEFTSEDYTDGEGEQVLASYGFPVQWRSLYPGVDWVLLRLPDTISSLVHRRRHAFTTLRMEPKPMATPTETEEEKEEGDKEEEIAKASLRDAAFIPVNLSFKDLCYEVKASTGSEKLRLLNNVSGVFSAGRMCALMGESGAGKTTLMDVIALRKRSGEISGDVLLNGFPQEPISFRRCSGYVEQFDVQSAELTVRETIKFSAELRLEKTNPVYSTPDGLDHHVDHIIKTMELTREADVLVGNAEEGGLTFEQKKRLSIAVELAASPSVVFLDEPTSGLDARAALLVMTALKKMCDTGRTIVATIHQPSSAVFDMFDDLLLLKKGGEVVFFGDLGSCSCNLVSYFEGLGASNMNKGENPATWMLNVLGEKIVATGDNGGEDGQLNFARANSSNYVELKQLLAQVTDSKDESCLIQYDTEFAVGWWRRDTLMARRLVTIYWRSPAYNLGRCVLAVAIAFLLGSVFIPIRSAETLLEAEITSMLSTIFISFIIIGVLSITSVMPVMLSIRDMFYRHKQAGMLNARSCSSPPAASSTLLVIARGRGSKKGLGFWGFFTFNTAIYSYIGQLFICLVPGGLIVRPQQMTGFWQITYWINPGHFVYEGLTMSVFYNDTRTVIVSEGSDYYYDLDCPDNLVDGNCEVQASIFVDAFFGGLFQRDHLMRNALILGGILAVVRLCTFIALRYLTYTGK
ncbi:LOW QUALITY PROTEIN: hypothetical protein ACHAXT_002920 [Thalassiosira profunda]